MGFPMAGHLAAAGHGVVVYNRTATEASRWVDQHGGANAPTPREAAAGRDFVLACVGNDDDLRAVALGPGGAFAGMKPGAIFVDHKTASANVACELHTKAAKLGLGFVDAPVSGGRRAPKTGR
jgi:3-hydroxyisobutyrate dehydrogenase-like beta-hydroxyacid dehydrogenase